MHELMQFERLEDRTLLSVTATLSAKKGILTIKGDGASDNVNLEGTGLQGQVDVIVNGASIGVFSGVKTIRANMGAGDDGLFVAALNIGGTLTVNMGAGADEFDLDDDPSFYAATDSLIGGSVLVKMGGNAGDYVDWDNDAGFGITIGNNVLIAGAADVDLNGDGGSSGVQAADIHIGGYLKITLNGSGNVAGNSADLYMDDVDVGGTTIITGSGSADLIRIEESAFARRVAINLKGGDDTLDLDQPGFNRFSAAALFNGAKGFDTLDEDAANVFLVPPVIRGFEVIV